MSQQMTVNKISKLTEMSWLWSIANTSQDSCITDGDKNTCTLLMVTVVSDFSDVKSTVWVNSKQQGTITYIQIKWAITHVYNYVTSGYNYDNNKEKIVSSKNNFWGKIWNIFLLILHAWTHAFFVTVVCFFSILKLFSVFLIL